MENNKYTLIRITTVPISFATLLKNQPKHFSQYYKVIAITSNGPEFRSVVENEQIHVEQINFTRKITPIQDLRALIKLYRFFKKTKPLIVHTHTPKAGLLGMIAAKFAGVPIKMHTIAGMPLLLKKGINKRILEVVERIGNGCADRIYPNSHELMKIVLKNKYAKKNKVKVLGNGSSNGVDTHYYDPNTVDKSITINLKKTLNISENDFVYCYIGRVVGDKGINETIEAFCQINNNNSNTKLLLVGPKEEHLNPINKVSQKLLENNKSIIYIDFQSDIRPYLSVSHVFVFPSYREGFPNGPMQAGAMGLPCIVTNINGCNEIIIDNYNGLIINPRNTVELYNAMIRLLIDIPLRQKLASKARERVVKMYSQNYLWEELYKEYESLKQCYLCADDKRKK